MKYFNNLGKLLAVALVAASCMLQYTGASAADTLIRDNGGSGTSSTGSWKVSSGSAPYGSDSYYASSNGASYTYLFDLDQPGEYQVYARWTEWSNRRTSVPYDIDHLGGKKTVTVNQRQNGGKWQKLGDTWSFGDSATISIRSLGDGSTSADAIKLVYVGGNTTTGQAFPLDLRGNTPEEASIVLNASKPSGASNATLALATYDADFQDEGELIINGNEPVSLFGSAGTGGNDQNSASISISTPASYWRNGDNTLVFRHTRTQGYIIDDATVTFSVSAGSNSTPTISGNPVTNMVVGNYYVFQPAAYDADGDNLTFVIANKPTWASFNSNTGRLSGTPGDPDIGVNSNIQIYVSDGHQGYASLPAFNISVQDVAPQTGSTSLKWTAPVARADGTALALSEIAGYKVYYGKTAGNYSNSLNINGGSSTSATISNLTTGTYYMVVTTRDSAGRESGQSSMVAKQVP